MARGIIFDIQGCSLVDGYGVRTTVFFKGCNLRCKWCHNPEGLSFDCEIAIDKTKCTGCNKCVEICPNNQKRCDLCGKCEVFCKSDARKIYGREINSHQLFEIISRDKPFYEQTGGGVTFSGGECMLQISFLEEILKLCKENGINTAVDTSGFAPWESFERILPYTDTFLYDIKCITESLHIEGTGKSNTLILENLKKLSNSGKEIIIRIPIIKGFNDCLSELAKIAELLKEINYKSVELLPYHNMAEGKYNSLSIPFNRYESVSREQIKELEKLFKK